MEADHATQTAKPDSRNAAFYSALEAALGHPVRPSRQSAVGPTAKTVPHTCRFTIVIPALNEEDAIGETLRNVLQARQSIIDGTPVTKVNVVVVNDGSTDRTQEIAESFAEVTVIRFEQNRGYGAAIKAGFAAEDSELVGFMDADGTLRAESWIPLVSKLFDENADVVLGARLNPESEMPLIRRIGNWGFARLLGMISGQPLTDCASGMRVIRRSSLKYLMPLPDGLHFTPAMSCNALLDRRLKICEHPVPYSERVGNSKLSVAQDGIRFLSIILLTGCFYNPLKCAAAGILCSWIAACIARLAGWKLDLLFPTVVGIDVLAVGAALVCHQAVKALILSDPPDSALERRLHACIQPRLLARIGFGWLAVSGLMTCFILLVGATAMSLLGGAALLVCFAGVALVLLAISLRMIGLIRLKFEALIADLRTCDFS